MIEQGLFFKKSKENFEIQDKFKELEKKFYNYLNEYELEYSKLLESKGDKKIIKEQKKRVKILNDKLLETADNVYNNIVELKKKSNNDEKSSLKESEQLEKYKKIKKLSKKDIITMDAFEEDYRLKMNSQRMKLIIWTILAKILLIGTILFFVKNGEGSTILKICLFTSALIVGYILLKIILDTFVRYCKESKTLGNFICYLLTKVFNI